MTLSSKGLPPATARLWAALSAQPLLSGFVLVGGTALALRIAHRISEDLDFAWGGERLPARRIDRLMERLRQDGFLVEKISSLAEEQEFLNDGLVLQDYQRDILVGTVRLTFFCADRELREVLDSLPREEGGPVVADLDRLFAAKALVCAHRSRTRDWLDLYLLMTKHGYRMEDLRAVFERHDRYGWDPAIARLVAAEPPPNDEGYRSLLVSPPTLDDLRAFFIGERARMESRLARAARSSGSDPESGAEDRDPHPGRRP